MAILKFKTLSPNTWPDFEKLFGERGACGGCWCMYWRLQNKIYEIEKGAGNKNLMKELVWNNEQIGIIMYSDEIPVGWCSFGPRKQFIRLSNSRILKPVDDRNVWSIVCFFVDKKHRGLGYSAKLIEEVKKNCTNKGVSIIEAYPIEPKKGKMAPVFIYTGINSSFKNAGFIEVARRSATRPIMRFYFSSP